MSLKLSDFLPPAPPDIPASSGQLSHAARWGAVTVSLDEGTLTAIARRFVDRVPELDDLRIEVREGELLATVVARRFGVPLSARAVLSQLRLKDGFLAFVLERAQALSFIPIPDAVIGNLVEKAPPGLLTYYREDRILVVNLNDWMPPGLEVSLDGADFGNGEARFHLAPGNFDLTEILRDGER